MNVSTPRAYTVEEVAAMLQVRPRAVYNLIHTGALRAVLIGQRQMRIPDEALAVYLAGAPTEPVLSASADR